jgi:hypothetical protein
MKACVELLPVEEPIFFYHGVINTNCLFMRSFCQQVFVVLQQTADASVRAIAKLTGIPRSSVHRYTVGIATRNQYPESHFWEREEGHQWLCLLVYATVYVFGIMRGVGAESLSLFFTLLHLQTHIGVSPSAIRTIRRKMESQLVRYQQEQEAEHRQYAKCSYEVCVGADETFFHDMLLVFMDLSSGYLFVEEASQDRTYDTWKAHAQRRLRQVGMTVRYVVSDRAKALIKLATDGFECVSVPDLFHATREICKLFGARLHRRRQRLQNKLTNAAAQLALLQELKDVGPDAIGLQEEVMAQLRHDSQHITTGIETYTCLLHRISFCVHPFALSPAVRPVTSAHVARELHTVADALEELREAYAITDTQKRLTKFTKQSDDLAIVIDTWWQWVDDYLEPYDLGEEYTLWLRECLLPTLYWQIQTERTAQPDLKLQYNRAAEQALSTLQHHPFTPQITENDLTYWHPWAEWMVAKFQRASSAVEGRNGYLSQMHHAGRGMTPQRVQALTVIHNFGLTRHDGTTAAQRLFGRERPDLFEWLVNQMGDLPLPRKARSPSKKTLLSLQSVPA